MKVISIVVAAAAFLAACGQSEPETSGRPPDVRRLSEQQYRAIIADVFGPGIAVAGRFDPLLRTDGLLTLGASEATFTPAGLAQIEEMARSVAAQVMSEPHHATLVPCQVEDAATFDEPCVREFLGRTGRLLFRRPLTDSELSGRVRLTQDAAAEVGDFHEGLAFGLASLLVAPEFLFVTDETMKDARGATQLTPYAKASRLSFFLWNTAPDDALLTAAERGDLESEDGLARQVDRMLASPRLKAGVRAFFTDMLGFSGFDTLEKDGIIYPAFGQAAAQDAREQTLRTIADHVVTRSADYRDLFTTTKTVMSRALGRVYRVRVAVADGGWEDYEFPPESSRVGIQSHLSFLALYSHAGRSSPTLRGEAVRTALLCQKVPDPPGDVDFSLFSDPNSPNKTARDRLSAHATSPACAGCHRITDPIGLALENFDGAGQFRTAENGVTINASGDLDGIPFADAVGLGRALRDNPATPSCLVSRMAAYATGRPAGRGDAWIGFLEGVFSESGYRVPALMRQIALSRAFFAVSAEKAEAS